MGLLGPGLLAGCGGSERAPFTLDPEFPPPPHCLKVSTAFSVEKREATARAVLRWNTALAEPLCLVEADADPATAIRTILPVERTDPRWTSPVEWLGPELAGYTEAGTLNILIPADATLESFRRVVIHEIGHVLGLRHVPPPAIMAEYTGSTDDLTENDLAECRRVGACP